MSKTRHLVGSALLLCAVTAQAWGPYDADLVRVIDGDTIVMSIHIYPEITVTTHLRILGIDTPELHRARCSAERVKGYQARDRAAKWLLEALALSVVDIRRGKYRMVGDIRNEEGESLAEMLLKAGLAHPYEGRMPRAGWCDS